MTTKDIGLTCLMKYKAVDMVDFSPLFILVATVDSLPQPNTFLCLITNMGIRPMIGTFEVEKKQMDDDQVRHY